MEDRHCPLHQGRGISEGLSSNTGAVDTTALRLSISDAGGQIWGWGRIQAGKQKGYQVQTSSTIHLWIWDKVLGSGRDFTGEPADWEDGRVALKRGSEWIQVPQEIRYIVRNAQVGSWQPKELFRRILWSRESKRHPTLCLRVETAKDWLLANPAGFCSQCNRTLPLQPFYVSLVLPGNKALK